MKKQLAKYPNMKLVTTVYGNDDPATSLTVLQGMLSAYPNLKGIISPTTVGISTAAQYLSTHPDVAKKVTLTGLGLPSQMSKYVKDGTVQSFELWNPSDLGYLAGYAAAALASGTTTLATGSTLRRRHAEELQDPGVRAAPPARRSCSARRPCSTSPTSISSTSDPLRSGPGSGGRSSPEPGSGQGISA